MNPYRDHKTSRVCKTTLLITTVAMTAVKRQGPLCSLVVTGKRRAAVALARTTAFLAGGAFRGSNLPRDILSIPELRYSLLRFAHFAYKRDATHLLQLIKANPTARKCSRDGQNVLQTGICSESEGSAAKHFSGVGTLNTIGKNVGG
jgi:hypothetical protein